MSSSCGPERVCIEKGRSTKRIGPTEKGLRGGSKGDPQKGRLPNENQREQGSGLTRWRGWSGIVTVSADEGGVIDW